MALEEEMAVTSRYFSAYGHTLEVVPSFKYMGRLLLDADDDWMAVIPNIKKAQSVWRIMRRILSSQEARLQVY